MSDESLRKIFKIFNRFMLFMWRLGFGSWGNGTKYGGYIMVIKHRGRKTGKKRLAPVNYAEIDDRIYCVSAMGDRSDWYRNLIANPEVELWLADGRWAGVVEDVTQMKGRAQILRQVIVASGFAGPLFGFNPRHMSDEDFDEMLETYRLLCVRKTAPVTGPDGPGDLAWVWPLSTLLLFWLLVRRGKRRRRETAGAA